MPRGSHAPQPRLSRRSFLLTLAGIGAAGAGVLVERLVSGPGHEAAAPLRKATPPASTARSASPSPTPPPSPSPTPARQALVIHAGGDTNLDPSYITTFRSEGYEFAWSGLNGIFERDDLSLVNCECPVSNLGSKWPGKQFNFRGDPAALPAMKAAGVNVANLGNNHAYDYGPTALLDTRKNLLAHDIEPVGAGRNPGQAVEPAMFETKGWTIAVVGFDKVVDPWPTAVAAPGHPGTAAGHDLDAMVAAVTAAKKDADLVVVAIHWGVELDTQPRADDVALATAWSTRVPTPSSAATPTVSSRWAVQRPPDLLFAGQLRLAELLHRRRHHRGRGGHGLKHGKVSGRLIPAFIEQPGHPVLRDS